MISNAIPGVLNAVMTNNVRTQNTSASKSAANDFQKALLTANAQSQAQVVSGSVAASLSNTANTTNTKDVSNVQNSDTSDKTVKTTEYTTDNSAKVDASKDKNAVNADRKKNQ